LSRARVYISGSQKRKIETEKKEKTQQVIQKNPKLTSFFQPLSSRSPGNITTESILHVAASQEQNEQGEDCESQVNTEGLLGVDTEQDSDQEVLAPTLITSKNQIIGGDDIGLWPPSATPEIIEYWTCQGEISDLRHSNGPFQKSNCARTGRSCTPAMFTNNLKNGEVTDRAWLCYSPSKGTLYCVFCRLLGGRAKDNA
jgi:hypothetical protein